MPQLNARARARLPNSAFAYVDSKGQRRLPIHDEAHVRNALARFEQTRFEDGAAREAARKRLLTAAKKHRIVPVGFITGQIATERLRGETRGRAGVAGDLPGGQVTFLLTDIEDSTGLLRRLGDGYARLLGEGRRLLPRAGQGGGGSEVDVRADELFAVFKRPAGALQTALAMQRSIRSRAWPPGTSVRVRIGIHTGRPTLTETGYVGLAVHAAARICAAGHGDQILVSDATVRAVEGSPPAGTTFRALGDHRLRGLPGREALFQLEAPELPAQFPTPRSGSKAGRPLRARRGGSGTPHGPGLPARPPPPPA